MTDKNDGWRRGENTSEKHTSEDHADPRYRGNKFQKIICPAHTLNQVSYVYTYRYNDKIDDQVFLFATHFSVFYMQKQKESLKSVQNI